MIPVLVTPPAEALVTLDHARAHLRVDHHDEDGRIEDLIAAATAHLDGRRGVLGRAIMPQTWAETHEGPGPYLLAMPDVASVTVLADGEPVAATVVATARGPVVEIEARPTEARITYTCGLPAVDVPRARVAVLLYLSHLYDGSDLSPAYDALVGALRWRSV